MKSICRLLMLCCLTSAATADAATHYVATNGHHVTPFTSWYNAATNIQAALDVATNGSTVLVTNGTYSAKSQILVTNAVTIASANGRDVTVITGCSTARCVSLMHSNAVVRGFTIRGGNALQGAGVYIYNGSRVEDCAIMNNRTESIFYGGQGAGIHVALDGVISGCTIISNVAGRGYGGGIYAANAITVTNCVIRGNDANYGSSEHPYGGYGGGLYLLNGGTVRGCAIEGNGGGAGGGVWCSGSWIEGCHIVSNATWFSYGFQSAYGGGIAAEGQYRIENCLLAYNTAGSHGGGLSGSTNGLIQNCTIVNNHEDGGGGGSSGAGTYGGTLRNCIVWGNTSGTTNALCNYVYSTITHTDTDPLPSGDGNLCADPLFVNPSAGDFHLGMLSPCIDSGTSNGAPLVDLDGTARPLDGNADGTAAFDMGAYEFAGANCDTDADGQSDFAEAVAGTDGTSSSNAFSARGSCPDSGGSGYVVRWDTVAGRMYTLQTKTSLFTSWTDVPSQTNLPGNGATMCYTNPAPAAGPEFYTIKVLRPR